MKEEQCHVDKRDTHVVRRVLAAERTVFVVLALIATMFIFLYRGNGIKYS